MIAVVILTLLLDAPAALAAPTCATAAPPDAIVSCPGWKPRTCRTRNAKGEFIRSRAVISEFKAKAGAAPKGYIYDHVRALDCGGCDVPWNLMPQTAADAKAKDKWERSPGVCGR